MTWAIGMGLLPYMLSFVIAVLVGLYTWQHRAVPGAAVYAFTSWAGALWILADLFKLISDTLEAKVFWDNVGFIGFAAAPLTAFMFAIQYTEHRLTKSKSLLPLILILPLLFILLIYTDTVHHLIRSAVYVLPTRPFSTLAYDFTLPVYFITAYLYLLVLLGSALLIDRLIHSPPVYRSQIATVLIGFLLPLIGGLLTFAGVTVNSQRDLFPFSFAASNIVVVWGLFRYRLFNLVPVAHETVVANFDAGIVVIDPHAQVVYLNAAARLMLAVQANIIGKDAAQVLPSWMDFASVKLSTEKLVTEKIVNTDGVQNYYELTLSLLNNHRQQPIGQLLVIRDITFRIHAQQQVLKRSMELEEINRNLQLASEALQETDRVKSHFLANMSHELRTPLNAILNFTEFVVRGMLGPINNNQVDALNKSLDSSKHLLGLINDVLDITKIEAGMMKLLIEENIDLHEELKPVIDTMHTLLKDKPVQFIEDIDGNLPMMTGDRRRIRQILLNLLSNAAKFTEQGSVTLSVKNRFEEVLFAIIDTGPGIAEADQQIIFEPFKQSEAGMMHAGGTGLGLPISKRLIEAHGGRLWMESEPGTGTAFYVTLPIIKHPRSLQADEA